MPPSLSTRTSRKPRVVRNAVLAVDLVTAIAQQRLAGERDFLRSDVDRRAHAVKNPIGRGQSFADGANALGVGNDDVGEGTAGID